KELPQLRCHLPRANSKTRCHVARRTSSRQESKGLSVRRGDLQHLARALHPPQTFVIDAHTLVDIVCQHSDPPQSASPYLTPVGRKQVAPPEAEPIAEGRAVAF